MDVSEQKILFTSGISDDQEHLLKDLLRGKWDIRPMISIEFRNSSEWIEIVPQDEAYWVFTSKNGVRAVLPEYFRLKEPAGVFCVGPSTAQLMDQRACSVSFPRVYDSEHLIEHIAENSSGRVVHFRGNLAGNDLTDSLNERGFEAVGIEVYDTLHTPAKVDLSYYRGLVFMSPSALEVFLKKNDPEKDQQLYCIGDKTASACRNEGFKNIMIPEHATFESLTELIKQDIS